MDSLFIYLFVCCFKGYSFADIATRGHCLVAVISHSVSWCRLQERENAHRRSRRLPWGCHRFEPLVH
jgi:hypothetical protein